MLELRTGIDFGAPTSCCTVGGVTVGGEKAVVALESAGAEASADDADWGEVVELGSVECLFFVTLASPGVRWPDPDPDSDAVASAAVVGGLGVLCPAG